MDELVQWLREQLDEDERDAQDALKRTTTTRRWIGGEWVEDVVQPPEWRRSAWSPARVLREIDAKRAMVNAYAEADAMSRASAENYGAWVNSEPLPHPEEAEGAAEVKDRLKGLHYALRLLALPYADRPGYRDDWRP